MKTYLLITDNLCQRCNNRWTSSYLGNINEALISPSYEPETIAGYFQYNKKHKACFACLDPSLPLLPSAGDLRYKLNTAPPLNTNPAPKAPLDLFGD